MITKEEPDFVVLKIITAGTSGVGKTTFLLRYREGAFLSDTAMTLGVEFFVKEVQIENRTVMLQIWDFTGQRHLRYMLDQHSYGANGALFMVELINLHRSLGDLDEWWSLLNKNGKIPILLVGTKYDLKESFQAKYEMNMKLIEQVRAKYDFVDFIETSSKTGYNIEVAVELLVKHILKNNL